MSVSIQFWDHVQIKQGNFLTWLWVPLPAYKVAEKLRASYMDLCEAFNQWADQDCPAEFYHKVTTGIGGSLEPYNIYVYIREFQGLNGVDPKNEGHGWVSLARDWGSNKRMISEAKYISFSKEIAL